ncbi:hypothetical protein ACFPRL_06675 [Pseudoclavibacter helvolus]
MAPGRCRQQWGLVDFAQEADRRCLCQQALVLFQIPPRDPRFDHALQEPEWHGPVFGFLLQVDRRGHQIGGVLYSLGPHDQVLVVRRGLVPLLTGLVQRQARVGEPGELLHHDVLRYP